MEALSHEDRSLSQRSAVTGAVAVLLSVVLVAPVFAVPAYGGWIALFLLGGALAAAARLLVATVAATPRRDPPPLPSSGRLPTVSLVVTAYDEADVLPATLDACTGLDYPDDRLQVVVGYEAASTDGTAAVAEAAAAADPRITAVERPAPPGGKASATNHALSAATGEVVGILDADQRPEPDAVSRAVRWLCADPDGSGPDQDRSDAPPVRCVKGRCLGTNARASVATLCATAERGLVERTEFVARDRLGGFALFTGGQAFFRAGTLEDLGGFDESVLLEDLEMAYRIQRAGGAVRVDPGIVTRERNPVRVSAWWSQRKRWARGGMQVARRYLGANLLSGPPSLPARVDFAATLVALLAVPVVALAAPAALLAPGGGVASGPVARWLWGAVLLAPALAWYGTVALDARDGYRHPPLEYAAPPLLWPYLCVQLGAVVTAFVDEFVLRRTARYVTS